MICLGVIMVRIPMAVQIMAGWLLFFCNHIHVTCVCSFISCLAGCLHPVKRTVELEMGGLGRRNLELTARYSFSGD